MSSILIIPKRIIAADKKGSILKNYSVEIKDDRIARIEKVSAVKLRLFKGEIVHGEDLTLIPGFVQTHVHLCQTLFRGMADDLELLDWLQLKIFPYENAHDKKSLAASVKLGINELTLSGTTTILDMGTLRHQEVIFDELISSGIRAFAGKCMIDINDLFPKFKSTAKAEVNESRLLAKAFHNEGNGRIKYGFAPRFALSSSAKLMRETKELMKDFPSSIFHTHSSENTDEIKTVKKKFKKNNIEYFNSLGVLDDHSVLAHCIHVNKNEVNLLKNKRVRVAHCPSSNLKLGSGIAPIPFYLKKGISVSLGADGAPCNNKLNMFNEMRLASLIQKPKHGATAINAETVFRLATIEGAKALNLENEIGSIEIGKKADLVLINLDNSIHPLVEDDQSMYSRLVYSGNENDVQHVMIDGKWVVKNAKSQIFDQQEILLDANQQLKNLLKRV
ncbi:MAG: amidohydrolase family protein [Ignavibacteriaceae bacterium]|nr:amidohydrolase family protein [Ignavibacteriaceae bacterium]